MAAGTRRHPRSALRNPQLNSVVVVVIRIDDACPLGTALTVLESRSRPSRDRSRATFRRVELRTLCYEKNTKIARAQILNRSFFHHVQKRNLPSSELTASK